MLSTILKHSVFVKTLLTDVQSICKRTQKYIGQDKNVFPMVLTVRTFLTRSTRLSNGLVQSARFLKPRKLPQNLLVRHQQAKLDINTNIKNNVILYKYENQRYIRIMHFIAIGQLFGWSLLAFYSYKSSFFDIFSTDVTFKEYLNQNGFRLIFFIFGILTGPLAYAIISITCARTVRYIILHKGGKDVTLTTCNLWSKNCNTQVPIKMVKCSSNRSTSVNFVMLKLKHKSLYYLVEKKGMFLNPELFDHTLGYSTFRKF